jgi:hypothetical protein
MKMEASPPASLIAFSVVFAADSFMSAISTLAPWDAKSLAVAIPTPVTFDDRVPDPVTIATLWAKRSIFGLRKKYVEFAVSIGFVP